MKQLILFSVFTYSSILQTFSQSKNILFGFQTGLLTTKDLNPIFSSKLGLMFNKDSDYVLVYQELDLTNDAYPLRSFTGIKFYKFQTYEKEYLYLISSVSVLNRPNLGLESRIKNSKVSFGLGKNINNKSSVELCIEYQGSEQKENVFVSLQIQRRLIYKRKNKKQTIKCPDL